jgi:hypothetical protein
MATPRRPLNGCNAMQQRNNTQSIAASFVYHLMDTKQWHCIGHLGLFDIGVERTSDNE